MIATFSAYDALDNLLPRETRHIVSNFHCEVEPYVLGIWISIGETEALPLYLTQEQLDDLDVIV